MASSSHSALLRPESRSLRDSFLKSFSSNYNIGRLYSDTGGELHEGKSPIEWMKFFKVIETSQASLTIQELQGLFLRLTNRYHVASSYHANLFAACEKLKSIIEQKQTSFIEAQLSRYRPGGDLYDTELKKAKERRPGKEILEKMAKHHTSEENRAYRDLQIEVNFFNFIMSDLEYQRRCLKDYTELMSLDPALRSLS
tara:strand:+ start:587 stop:1180 length:594 start_codon:yes stop_codon:yes gene_type:complete